MIPRDYITAWRSEAPWVQDFQVEQDLIISKALVDIFSEPLLRESLAFRGGTALYKLFLKPPLRYSEDIGPLLARGYDRDIEDMAATVSDGLIARLPGEPWQGSE